MTLPDIRAAKAAGTPLAQLHAVNPEEAEAAAEAGIDMLSVSGSIIEKARAVAPNTYIVAALGGFEFLTTDDVLRETARVAIAGADQIHTLRRMDVVEVLAKEGFAVEGHVGLVPRRSITTGGLRAYGKTVEEAITIFEDVRRLEDAGAVAVEMECVAAEAVTAISRNTSLITHAIGSGSGGDIILMFTEDICGEHQNPLRHARAFGDVRTIRNKLNKERKKAVVAYRQAVKEGSFPDPSASTAMLEGEHEKLLEAIDKRRPLHT